MTSAQFLTDLAKQITERATTERDRAVMLHDYVRDCVKFGFTTHFDHDLPEDALAAGVGCCTTKARLLVALLNAVEIEAYHHFVVISKSVLSGLMPASIYRLVPGAVSHSNVDVRIGDHWYEIDSFIVDTPLLIAGKARLAQEGLTVGYGVHRNSTNAWDGRHNAFSQYTPSILVADHGRVEDVEAYFGSRRYRNKVLGVPFSRIFAAFGERSVAPINAGIDAIRREFTAAPAGVG
ncbi:MAG: hypothetical protein IPM16_17260 [Chloroflexi bacterium]|nr:hypothetical protein [Chloroflexota bacterium]